MEHIGHDEQPQRGHRGAAAVATAGTVVAGAVAAAAAAGRRVAGTAGRRAAGMVAERLGAGGHEDPARWRVVTVYRPYDDLRDQLPEPLSRLGEVIEVQVRPAPGDKGTELAARLAPARLAALQAAGQTPAGNSPDAGRGAVRGDPVTRALEELRTALRQAKQLAEVGWIHEANANSTTTTTPLNAPMREAMRHAGGEGQP